MKTVLYFFVFLLVLSCSDDDDQQFLSGDSLPGKWLLVEAFFDPGDGSGEYEEVNSNRHLEFTDDMSIVTTNIPVCSLEFNSETEEIYSGEIVYDYQGQPVDELNADFVIKSGDCEVLVTHEPPYIIVYLNCIEGCGLKFRKISD